MSNPWGGSFNAVDAIFSPARSHQIEEEARRELLISQVETPGSGPRGIELDLDSGVAVIHTSGAGTAQQTTFKADPVSRSHRLDSKRLPEGGHPEAE